MSNRTLCGTLNVGPAAIHMTTDAGRTTRPEQLGPEQGRASHILRRYRAKYLTLKLHVGGDRASPLEEVELP